MTVVVVVTTTTLVVVVSSNQGGVGEHYSQNNEDHQPRLLVQPHDFDSEDELQCIAGGYGNYGPVGKLTHTDENESKHSRFPEERLCDRTR